MRRNKPHAAITNSWVSLYIGRVENQDNLHGVAVAQTENFPLSDLCLEFLHTAIPASVHELPPLAANL